MYLAERVSFVHVEATLHAHTCLPLQLPENQPTCMTLHCNTHSQEDYSEKQVMCCNWRFTVHSMCYVSQREEWGHNGVASGLYGMENDKIHDRVEKPRCCHFVS